MMSQENIKLSLGQYLGCLKGNVGQHEVLLWPNITEMPQRIIQGDTKCCPGTTLNPMFVPGEA
jgi:hypothetical protein